MFTGLIEKLGRVLAIETRGDGARLRIGHDAWDSPLQLGESVAMQGVCLTAATCDGTSFACDVLRETLARTTLGALRPGAIVNLERAMRADGRFGGHLVSGHIDGTGAIAQIEPVGVDRVLVIGCEHDLTQGMVFKGSVALDGVSLTITDVQADCFSVHLIPHTLQHTSLQDVRTGQRVNLEIDMIGKYVRKWLDGRGGAPMGLTLEHLRDAGFG